MQDEYKYIEYMLNPPEFLEPGQIWKYPTKGLEFIITEVFSSREKKSPDTVVRASIITPIKYLADENDVTLRDDAIASEVFHRERFVLRITDGPIAARWFKIYSGKVEDKTLQEIKESLKIKNYSYDETQQILINELLESLEPVRHEAVNIYEETASEEIDSENLIIINLPVIEKEFTEETIRLAASDFSAEEKNIEFWRKERDAIYKTELPLNIPNLVIRISFVDDWHYLIIVTDKYKNIDRIEIFENEEAFFKKENLVIETQRIPILINKKFNEEAVYRFEIELEGKSLSAYFMVNYGK